GVGPVVGGGRVVLAESHPAHVLHAVAVRRPGRYQNPLGEGLATPELELVVGGGDPMDQMAGLGQSGLADAVPADLGDGLVEIVDREVVAEAAQDGADYHRIGVTLGEAGAELLL